MHIYTLEFLEGRQRAQLINLVQQILPDAPTLTLLIVHDGINKRNELETLILIIQDA